MLLTVGVLIMLAALAMIHGLREPGGTTVLELGWMSEQWLAEQRSSHAALMLPAELWSTMRSTRRREGMSRGFARTLAIPLWAIGFLMVVLTAAPTALLLTVIVGVSVVVVESEPVAGTPSAMPIASSVF